jgi:hypothetical protein
MYLQNFKLHIVLNPGQSLPAKLRWLSGYIKSDYDG